ncbi:MAG: glycosyltransferase family 4 protein, partial [Gammaproteobacteria bacterium]|nr:glycosyltransferase family 4 protein [Gammaproteobacteria bacterium]
MTHRDSMQRALLITRNLPPVQGGMERLIGQVAEALCTQYETAIVGPRGARLDCRPAAFHGCPLSPPARFLAGAAFRARAAARRHHPGLVLAGSGLVAPLARLAARRAGAPYAVYVHGLDIVAPHPIYRRFFLPAIRAADLVIANSRYTAGLAERAGVPKGHIRILHPGVEVPAPVPDHAWAASAFRAQYDLPAGPILFGAGRFTPRKGFADFVTHALPAVLEKLPEAQLVIAGGVPQQAVKRAGNEAEAIRRAAAAAGVAKHVHLIGSPDDAGRARAWAAADGHVFPGRDDPADPEGFGMVALEAAAQGAPTVAFAAGGV